MKLNIKPKKHQKPITSLGPLDKSISTHVDEILKEVKRHKELRKQANSLEYPAYFVIYDHPYKFEKMGRKIYTNDMNRENYTVEDALYEGCHITKEEYVKMVRRLKRIRRQ